MTSPYDDVTMSPAEATTTMMTDDDGDCEHSDTKEGEDEDRDENKD
jgi:hypothetical protein